MGLFGGVNAYAYGFNTPTTLTDRLGLVPDCEVTVLDTFLEVSYKTVKTIIDTFSFVEPKLVGVGLGGDTPPLGDPPIRPPISPELDFELWMVQYTQWQEEIYKISQWFEKVWIYCIEFRTECEETKRYVFIWEETRPKGEAKPELTSSNTWWTRRELYRIGRVSLPIIPF
jgi:hypothetical protein